jgi:hypothetical protein
LITSLLAALVQSLPFAYFLGTGFWCAPLRQPRRPALGKRASSG